MPPLEAAIPYFLNPEQEIPKVRIPREAGVPEEVPPEELRYWKGRLVPHLDSVAHLRPYAYSLLKVREIARRSLQVTTAFRAKGVAGVYRFLLGCRYATDEELFKRKDYWQTPDEFESNRAGDCEDHAMWAWRQCLDLGDDARFTIGGFRKGAHAWVTLFEHNIPFVLEATAKDTRELEPFKAPSRYEPSFSIDGKLRFYQHVR